MMTNNLKKIVQTTLLFVLVTVTFSLQAQDWKKDKNINVLFGLTQPVLLSGFNIEGNYIHNRLIFDYSHGVSLNFSGSALNTELKNQGVVVHMPWTTGFGIGYRLKEWINVRVEPKWHRFEFYYDGATQNTANEIVSYNTMSLGIGVYGNFQPFKNKSSFLKGIMIAPSIRFWPTISSTLKDDKYTYLNSKTMKNEEIKTLDPGFGFTPLVINVSIGYTFSLKKTIK
jgi:hypothetical protein